MMPLIRPLPIPGDPPTEYQKERESFARMQVDFHIRNPPSRRIARPLAAFFGRLVRIGPRATPEEDLTT